MSVSQVYFTDFHTPAYGDSLPTKLQKLLKKAGIGLNRKMLAELAVSDAAAFAGLVEKAKAAL